MCEHCDVEKVAIPQSSVAALRTLNIKYGNSPDSGPRQTPPRPSSLSSAEVSGKSEGNNGGTGHVYARGVCARGPVCPALPPESRIRVPFNSLSPACNFLSSLFILHLTLTLTTADREAWIAQFMVLHHVAEPASVTPLSLTARVMYFLCSPFPLSWHCA